MSTPTPARPAKAVLPIRSLKRLAKWLGIPKWRASNAKALQDYIERALRGGTEPNELFDSRYYLEQNPDVAAAGLNPLAHYLSHGAKDGKLPHPLFDPHYYCASNPAVADLKDALAHYLRHGALLANPHPLFDTRYYLEQVPELAGSGDNPLVHYLAYGAALGKHPHPLFDTSWYLEQYPDVASSGENPLVHFVRWGGSEGRQPHPLFDSAYYFERSADLGKSGTNPLVHYLCTGAREGRDPHRLFDTSYYLKRYPEVSGSALNPLVHYVRWGAAEGRDPHPQFSGGQYLSEHPELGRSGANPLVHYLAAAVPATRPKRVRETVVRRGPAAEYKVRDFSASKARHSFEQADTVVCVTHVPPVPPRAGNEYRMFRLLRHLQNCRYRVVLVLSPLAGEEISEQQFLASCEWFPNSILCARDGTLLVRMAEGAGVVKPLHGSRVVGFAARLKEETVTGPARRWLDTDCTFCHDALIQPVLSLLQALGPAAVLAEYVFMTRFLPMVGPESLKLVDTHDVFSAKEAKVLRFGLTDGLSMRPQDERERLLRADLVLAIQRAEQQELAALVPERSVIEVGVDFDVVRSSSPPKGRSILYVASDNPMNVRGLRDFLRFGWPLVRQAVSDAEVLVAGRVCRSTACADPRVRLLGLVDRIEDVYAEARVVINPSVAGTGLKIKTLEAMASLRPIVTWPSGTDGMSPEIQQLCLTAEDWPQFAEQIQRVLNDDKAEWYSPHDVNVIRAALSPDAVYAGLRRELAHYFAQQRQ